MSASASRYTAGNGDANHKNTSNTDFRDQSTYAGPTCWRDWFSSQPLLWDFYRNATQNSDQLRQRVAFALQQIVVVNDLDVEGTYGLRNYHNTLLDNAFGSYRQVLKKVTLSPVMGDFLNNANSALERLNFLTYLLYWGGSTASASVPGAFGTTVDTTPFEADAADAAVLVDRLSVLATGAALPAGTRTRIITAVEAFTSANNANWQRGRVRQAAYLVFATPAFQVQR